MQVRRFWSPISKIYVSCLRQWRWMKFNQQCSLQLELALKSHQGFLFLLFLKKFLLLTFFFFKWKCVRQWHQVKTVCNETVPFQWSRGEMRVFGRSSTWSEWKELEDFNIWNRYQRLAHGVKGPAIVDKRITNQHRASPHQRKQLLFHRILL